MFEYDVVFSSIFFGFKKFLWIGSFWSCSSEGFTVYISIVERKESFGRTPEKCRGTMGREEKGEARYRRMLEIT